MTNKIINPIGIDNTTGQLEINSYAGINIPSVTVDPSSPPNGTIWYRSDTDKLYIQLSSGITQIN